MRSYESFESFYLHKEPIDFRKGILSLCILVKEEMNLDLKSNSLFLFINKKRSHLKILYFDLSGFALWLKKLEESKFPWPQDGEEVLKVSEEDLSFLFKGINPWSSFKEVHFGEFI